MANPNIAALTTLTGNTTYYTPSGTTAVVLLPNAAASGQVFRINQITATNVNGSAAVNATVSIYTNGAVAQGSAPSGGTAYPIASTISVPADATLIVTDKTTSFYLLENQSIGATAGTASDLVVTASWEEINS